LAARTGAAAFLGDAVPRSDSEVERRWGNRMVRGMHCFIALARRGGMREGVTIAAIGAW